MAVLYGTELVFVRDCATLNSTVPYSTAPALCVYQVRDILYVLNTYTTFAIALVGKGEGAEIQLIRSIQYECF